jgi:hypothetical protein
MLLVHRFPNSPVRMIVPCHLRINVICISIERRLEGVFIYNSR